MKGKLIILIGSLLATYNLFAQTTNSNTGLYVDFPFFDLPYQSYAAETTGNFFTGYANPSMKQSLAMSNNLYTSAHWGINKLIKTKSEFKKILFTTLIASGFDLLTFYTPFGMGWLHEEYHRAVMTRREINSFNDMNTFPIGSDEVSVRKVADEDLITLSDEHKQDFRRLMVAGHEAQFLQIQTLQKNNFFYNQDLPNIPLYWMSSMTNIIYVNESTSDSFDELVDEVNDRDGADIAKRDFTGPDFTAWVDGLFFPDKPYSDRGTHPSGVGINRYIKPSQLSPEAKDYLQKQGNLQWLNLLSPHLSGFPKIKLKSADGGSYYGSFALRHLLTSFGNDINLDLFYQTPSYNIFVTLHNYNNLNNTFFGLEGALIDLPFYFDKKLLLTPRALVWTQPKDGSFTTSDGSLGGLLGLRSSYNIGSLSPYVEIEGKTEGWAMGNVFLENNISLTLGLYIRI